MAAVEQTVAAVEQTLAAVEQMLAAVEQTAHTHSHPQTEPTICVTGVAVAGLLA